MISAADARRQLDSLLEVESAYRDDRVERKRVPPTFDSGRIVEKNAPSNDESQELNLLDVRIRQNRT